MTCLYDIITTVDVFIEFNCLESDSSFYRYSLNILLFLSYIFKFCKVIYNALVSNVYYLNSAKLEVIISA